MDKYGRSDQKGGGRNRARLNAIADRMLRARGIDPEKSVMSKAYSAG